MLKATAGKVLPTTIIGSLPRPSWYTENLGTKSFLDAMTNNKFREQYTDALACYLRDQEVAGLDVVTDGDCRFDQDVGGQTWTSYPPRHMTGFEATHVEETIADLEASIVEGPQGVGDPVVLLDQTRFELLRRSKLSDESAESRVVV